LKIEPIKEEEIERAIKNLKPGKSPDIDGISAPRFKYALDNFCEDFCYSDSSIICWILPVFIFL
jgi:hypothetical protein